MFDQFKCTKMEEKNGNKKNSRKTADQFSATFLIFIFNKTLPIKFIRVQYIQFWYFQRPKIVIQITEFN